MYIINLKKTWEKLLLAARAIVAIENPADVCVISSRNTGQVRPPLLAHLTYDGPEFLLGYVQEAQNGSQQSKEERYYLYLSNKKLVFIYWCALMNITLVSSVGLM